MKLHLEVCPPSLPPYRFERDNEQAGGEISIGRDPDCVLSLAGDAAKNVSWHHASISMSPDGAFLTDAGSSNGTFVNETRVSGKTKLHIGDQIGLGQLGPRLQVVVLDTTRGYTPTVAEKMVKPSNGLDPLPTPVSRSVAPELPAPSNGPTPAAPMSATRQMMVRMESRQKKMWTLFGSAVAILVIAIIAILAVFNREKHAGREVYKRTLPSVAWIILERPPERRPDGGTGTLIDSKRKLLLTAYHVVCNKEKVEVFFPKFDGRGDPLVDPAHYLTAEKSIQAEVWVRDPSRDLALLKLESIPHGLTEVRLASSSSKITDYLHTIGNPKDSDRLWGYTSGTSRGLVKKRDHRLKACDGSISLNAQVVEMQNPINPGDSGGPVMSDQGELVGVNSHQFGDEGGGMSAAIDVSEVRALLASADKKD